MKLQKDVIKPLVALTVLAAVILIAASATGVAWVKTAGGMLVLGIGMFWGRALRARRIRESQAPGALPPPAASHGEQDT
ncbi:hypothetical protein ACFYUM_08725 [Streptomyces fimicarius]|uniref:hypothetical protein n=1 Tax=Streptomyces griseus TaxID=1911 RepID=UPI0029C3ACF3|nr:hypothetical protein [Streptomyces sp. ID01-9D]